MKFINPLMVIWIIIHAIITLIFGISSEPESYFIFYFSLVFFILNCIGLLLIITDQVKIGGLLFLIGSAVLIPIGLIGAFGARKLLNKIKKDKFLETL